LQSAEEVIAEECFADVLSRDCHGSSADTETDAGLRQVDAAGVLEVVELDAKNSAVAGRTRRGGSVEAD